MIHLILTVLLTSTWLVSFRALKILKINTFQAVVINYWVCVLTGVLVFQAGDELLHVLFNRSWIPHAFFTGLLFILTFYLTALGAQSIGVAAVTIAGKIALVIPVLFSLFVLRVAVQEFDWLNYLGIILSLLAIVLSALKNSNSETVHLNQRNLIHLGAIFGLSGIVDTFLNYVNLHFIPAEEAHLFTIAAFGSAAIIGLLIMSYRWIIHQTFFSSRSILGGIWIGIPNFFSLYYLLLSLDYFDNNGAFLFPMFNIAIIVLSSLAAILIYRERLSLLNRLGVFLAVISMFFIAYQEVIEALIKLLGI